MIGEPQPPPPAFPAWRDEPDPVKRAEQVLRFADMYGAYAHRFAPDLLALIGRLLERVRQHEAARDMGAYFEAHSPLKRGEVDSVLRKAERLIAAVRKDAAFQAGFVLGQGGTTTADEAIGAWRTAHPAGELALPPAPVRAEVDELLAEAKRLLEPYGDETWHRGTESKYACVHGAGGRVVAERFGGGSMEPHDVRLVAAAPDLLRRLVQAVERVAGDPQTWAAAAWVAQANNELLDGAVVVWPFAQAPEALRGLSDNGGDEDWVAFAPAVRVGGGGWPPDWLAAGPFGICTVAVYLLPDGSEVRIGAHA